MELSDFKLLLRQPVASVGGHDDLCISASAHPSHLELVQLIDMNQVPLLFLSGVQLQLYPIPYYNNDVLIAIVHV